MIYREKDSRNHQTKKSWCGNSMITIGVVEHEAEKQRDFNNNKKRTLGKF